MAIESKRRIERLDLLFDMKNGFVECNVRDKIHAKEIHASF